jgi:hypothetical protein
MSGVAGGQIMNRYIIWTPRTQLPNSWPGAITQAVARFPLLRGDNGWAFAAPGLTGQKIFIYGIPEEMLSWLAAHMPGSVRLVGAKRWGDGSHIRCCG